MLANSVGLALLVILETLQPAERLAFVLHDLFAMSFEEIAPIVDRSPAAARQLASRARRGDFEALLTMLDPESRCAALDPKCAARMRSHSARWCCA